MTIKIEKNVPMPSRNSRSRGLASALRALEIGDSFVYHRQSGFAKLLKFLGIKIATRKQPDGTYRIWRIE